MFDAKKIGQAHQWNQQRAKDAMAKGISPVVIDNTNTTLKEMYSYVSLGKKFNYEIKFLEPDWHSELKTPDGKWNYDFIKSLQDKRKQDQPTKNIPDDVVKRMIERYDYRKPEETDTELSDRVLKLFNKSI